MNDRRMLGILLLDVGVGTGGVALLDDPLNESAICAEVIPVGWGRCRGAAGGGAPMEPIFACLAGTADLPNRSILYHISVFVSIARIAPLM